MNSCIYKLCKRFVSFLAISGFVIFCSGVAMAEELRVVMKGWILHPENFTVQIHAGDTVTWVNDDDAQHTITFEDAAMKSSENLSPGREFSITFDKAGEYTYYCKYHKDLGMKGTITVIAKQ